MSNPAPPDDLPPQEPYVQIPLQELGNYGSPVVVNAAPEDQDNFVRDLVTVLTGGISGGSATAGTGDSAPPPVPPSSSAAGRLPVVALDEIKLWLRIEPSQTVEDNELVMMEMAARIHTENFLRQTLDADLAANPGGIGENIKQAMLLLIAHWYRNRELMVSGRLANTPFAYIALLAPERDYSGSY